MPADGAFYGDGTMIGRIDPLGVPGPVVYSSAADESIATIKRLSSELASRSEAMNRFDAYYRGDHGLRFQSSDHKAAFAKIFAGYAENFCGIVIDAVEERLDVLGFRFPKGSTPSDVAGSDDTKAWQIWQDNQLDAGSQVAHTEALVKGVVYVLVSPFESELILGRSPKITVEDPTQAIVEYTPGTRDRRAGLKRWYDPDQARTLATLYLPDRIEKWQTVVRRWGNQYGSGAVAIPDQWERRVVPGEPWPLDNPLGVVPLVPLVNRPRLKGEGVSELKSVVPIQDAINKLAVDGLTTSDSAAFPQRWATGIEIPTDPDTGKPIESWRAAIDRFISTKVENAKFGQFEPADLSGYTSSIEQKVQSLATIAGLPFSFFESHSGQPPSAESLLASESRLNKKVERRQTSFGEGWEEVQRLAFKSLADERADVLDCETHWRNPKTESLAQKADALVKLRGLGVPFVQIWEDYGYSPAQITGFKAALIEERTWLNATPAKTTQPTAFPGPQDSPPDDGTSPSGPTDGPAAAGAAPEGGALDG